MDHHLAIKEQLPERYAFGELSETERDDFEEHLADCSRCMDDVRSAQSFAANAYAVFRDDAQKPVPAREPRVQWWRAPWALAFSGGLNIALAGAALYAFLALIPFMKSQIRSLQAPVISESFVLAGASRAARPVYTVSRNAAATFRLDLPQQFDSYLCEIHPRSGEAEKAYNLRMAGVGETLNVTIPVAGLDPGDYDVTLGGLQGAQSQTLASFVLRVTAVH